MPTDRTGARKKTGDRGKKLKRRMLSPKLTEAISSFIHHLAVDNIRNHVTAWCHGVMPQVTPARGGGAPLDPVGSNPGSFPWPRLRGQVAVRQPFRLDDKFAGRRRRFKWTPCLPGEPNESPSPHVPHLLKVVSKSPAWYTITAFHGTLPDGIGRVAPTQRR